MQILWCGGENIDFNRCIYQEYNSVTYRSDYARSSIEPQTGSSVIISNPFWGGSVTSCWLVARVHWDSSLTWQRCIGFGQRNKTLGTGLWLSSGDSRDRFALRTYNGDSGSTLVQGPYTFRNYYLHHIAIQVISYGALGTINVFQNRLQVMTYTGDITAGSMSAIDCIVFTGQAGYVRASEVIVTDNDPRALSLMSHVPNGAGTSSQWTGAYTAIDDTEIDDSDCVYTDTDDYNGRFAMTDCKSGTFYVRGIKTVARACSPSGSTANVLKLGVYSNSTVDVDSGQLLGESFESVERWASTINGNPMTPALLNSMELNLRSEVYTS